jgi:histidinol dehydrogenase
MLTRLDLRSATIGGPLPESSRRLADLLPRPGVAGKGPVAAVRRILDEVREGGDDALRALTERFDGARVDELGVPAAEIKEALDRTPPAVRGALEVAAESIDRYHRQLTDAPVAEMTAAAGVRLRATTVPVDRAGCYVPGGRARYPSTVLMTAVVAKVAGVREVVLVTPPGPDGAIPDITLAAAAVAGIDEIYRVGGAQAIAALAYGTASIAPVDVIVGPGNIYVAIAKREVAQEGLVGVPSSFTGPSEVVVIADSSVAPAFAAIDVVVQAEHGPDGLAWLIAWDEAVLQAVVVEIERLVAGNPRREDIEATFAAGGHAVLVDSPGDAVAVSNAIAPEHLELMVADPEALLPLVRHAGAVFTGAWSPASVGDYVAGPSHVLPTFGSARFGEALGVRDFVKHVHIVTLDEPGLRSVGPYVVTLAEQEGLPAHAQSVRLRLEGR